jgi:hypothetical protein
MMDRDDRLNDGCGYIIVSHKFYLKSLPRALKEKRKKKMNCLTKADGTACAGKCHDDSALAEIATEGNADAKR